MTWRRVYAALPAIALIGGGVALSSPALPPPHNIDAVAVSSDAPIVVPGTALTLPAPPAAGVSTDAPPVAAPGTPAPVVVKDAAQRSSALVTLDNTGIPVLALEGYRRAASLIGSADPVCHIDWALLAGIGKVESNHGRFGGNQLDSAGVAQPGIIGIPLDGSNSTARITDTDEGLLDRDSVFDRAVGPMQFIPGTWRVVGVDGDGDGVKNPQDMVDAASASAIYLCSGPGDLSLPADLSAAIMRYNASDSYVRMVTAIADAYRHGVTALPEADLPAAIPVTSSTGAVQPGQIPTALSWQTPAAALGAATAIPPTSAPAPSVGSTPVATSPVTPPPVVTPPVVTPPVVTPPVVTPPVVTPPVVTPPVVTPPVVTPPVVTPPVVTPPVVTPPVVTPPVTPPPTPAPDPTPTPDPTPAPDPTPTATASRSTPPPTATPNPTATAPPAPTATAGALTPPPTG